MKTEYDILIEPVLAEKAENVREHGVYVFKVAPYANKPEIKKAVEKIFKVKVEKVNVLTIKGKTKKVNFRFTTKTQGYKKAYVKLAKGNSIELFEGI